MASTYLTYTPSSAVTLATKATISFWVKRSKLDSSGNFYGILSSNGGWNDGAGFAIGWREDMLVWYNLANASGYRTYTNRKFRDTNAWYHIVYKIDTTQASMQDRITLYVNGVDEGDLTSNTSISNAMPSQNASLNQFFDSGDQHQIGRGGSAGSTYFDGSLSHFHYVDGSALAPTVFGSTDSTTGEWKINTSPSYTVGNNGFFILKDGNSVTDQSANSNNFTVTGGTLTKTEDNPSNVFATGNPSYYFNGGHTFSNGNNTMYISGGWRSIISTLGTGTGKYYAEAKFVSIHSGSNNAVAGITALDGTIDNSIAQNLHGNLNTGSTYGLHNNGNFQAKSSYTINPYSASWTAGDIIGIAVDTENNKIYFSKNGSWQYSSDPSNGTNGVSIDANQNYGIGCSGYYNTMAMNYGNGYFGSTQISSAGTNASGIGIFEYDVPTGFTALSTKGLNQ